MIKKRLILEFLIIFIVSLTILLFLTTVLAIDISGKVTIKSQGNEVGISRSGGGQGGSCKTNWTCTDWSFCFNGTENRICTKILESCATGEKPETQRTCKPVEEKNISTQKKALFDISLKVLNKEIKFGESLQTSINLINFGILGKVNVSLHYTITDSNGKTVYEKEEIIPVETQNEFIKNIDTSKLEEGNYTLIIDLKYEGQKENTRTQESFTVIKNKEKNNKIRLLFISIIILIISIIIILTSLFIKLKKKSKLKDKSGQNPLTIKPEQK